MTGNAENSGVRRGSLWRSAPWIIAGLLLLAPLVAMQFDTGVDWTVSDFVIMGVMLLFVCGPFELAARLTSNWAYRAAVAVALIAAFLLVWINLAVGIIGSEDNPANLMFAGVLAIGLIGGLISGFRSAGMARTLLAVAAAQVLVGAVAFIGDLGAGGENWPRVIFVLTGVFTALWLGSAALFRKAARNA